MKAAVYTEYGSPDVVRIEEVEKPIPMENEVLIRTHATTVLTGDWRARSLTMHAGFRPFGRLFFGISGPRQTILGTELASEITTVFEHRVWGGLSLANIVLIQMSLFFVGIAFFLGWVI